MPSTQHDSLDPAFEKVPFNQWLGEGPGPQFHWKVRVSRAELSFHQRLVASVEIALDGKDLETRRDGRLVFLIQISGGDGARYQDHSSVELNKLDENIKTADLGISHRAFFLPGDYQLAAVVFDSATGEHSVIQTQFRVAAPTAAGFLEDAWRDLPAVEFLHNELSPDSWYLPEVRGRLDWAAEAHAPARLGVILNVAPSMAEPGSRATPSSGMGALLPALKALSETGSPSLAENVDVLDLGRRRDVFHQQEVKDLDWPRLKTSLGDANTASIDLHSLADRHHDAQFFVSEVRRLLWAADAPSVLVVLTTAVAFESGEDLKPISLEALPPARVFYIRYRAPMQAGRPFGPQMGGRGGRGRMGGGPMMNQTSHGVVDRLEATLKPLRPKVFDVETPEQMTKAFKEIRNALMTVDGQAAR